MKDSWMRALEEDLFHMEVGVLAVLVGVAKVAGVDAKRRVQKARWVPRLTRFGSRNGEVI
jgi:hypothetical protein